MGVVAVSYLADVAEALLQAALAGLAAATTGHAPPDVVYVEHDSPLVLGRACGDGILTVHLELVRHVPTEDDNFRQSCQVLPTPTWVITLLRCVPGLREGVNAPLPPVDDLDAAYKDLLVDLWALLTELYDRLANDTLIPGLDDSCDFTIGEASLIGPEGRVAGWEIRVTHVTNDQGPIGS